MEKAITDAVNAAVTAAIDNTVPVAVNNAVSTAISACINTTFATVIDQAVEAKIKQMEIGMAKRIDRATEEAHLLAGVDAVCLVSYQSYLSGCALTYATLRRHP
jgi:hypothetical protein